MTTTDYDLKTAAQASVKIHPGKDGRRAGDPLLALIPGDGQAHRVMLDLVESITGRKIEREAATVWNTAPAARAALRRWAVRQEHEVQRSRAELLAELGVSQ